MLMSMLMSMCSPCSRVAREPRHHRSPHRHTGSGRARGHSGERAGHRPPDPASCVAAHLPHEHVTTSVRDATSHSRRRSSLILYYVVLYCTVWSSSSPSNAPRTARPACGGACYTARPCTTGTVAASSTASSAAEGGRPAAAVSAGCFFFGASNPGMKGLAAAPSRSVLPSLWVVPGGGGPPCDRSCEPGLRSTGPRLFGGMQAYVHAASECSQRKMVVTCRARTHTVQSPECCSAERRMRWDLSVLWRVGSGRDEAGRGVEPPVELGGGGRDLRKARGEKAGEGERR